MDDDILDVLGISVFPLGSRWCDLKRAPCVPFASCEVCIFDGECLFEAHEDDDRSTEK
jgi:hypothetical protein